MNTSVQGLFYLLTENFYKNTLPYTFTLYFLIFPSTFTTSILYLSINNHLTKYI